MTKYTRLSSLLLSGLLVVMSQATVAGGYYHHGHHDHGHGGAIAASLIIGGLFGYLISENQRNYSSYRTDYYPRSTVVYQRVERIPTVIPVERHTEFAGSDCLMTREYTTTININGVDREAYGTRCMTADGGWILGRPKLVPEY